LISVILAGGEGRRLQPLSTPENPKQFIDFDYFGGSLFQSTYKRALKISGEGDIYIVTNERYVPKVTEQLMEIGIRAKPSNILGEPMARNTLPAIMAAVLQPGVNKGDVVTVFPADHYIGNNDVFIGILHESMPLASESIVTFGIKPLYAEKGYGYIQPGEPSKNGYYVQSFKEKPDEATAGIYIKNRYLWNAGIFMFSADVFLGEVERYEPGIFSAFSSGGDIREIVASIEKGISIDKGVLEKSGKVTVVPMDIEWSDLGSFDSIYNIMPVVPFEPEPGDSEVGAGASYHMIMRKDNGIYLRGEKGTVLVRRGRYIPRNTQKIIN